MARCAIIGLGRFGGTLAEILAASGMDVIAIDSDPARVDSFKEKVSVAVALDATDEAALLSQGINKVDFAVIGIGEDFETNQLATLIIKNIGVKRVIARAVTAIQARILSLIGADEVILPEVESARRLAQQLSKPNVIEYLELADGHSLVEMKAPSQFAGKSIRELNLRKEMGINLIAVKQKKRIPGTTDYEEKVNDVPNPDYVIQADDVLVLVGSDKSIDRLTKR